MGVHDRNNDQWSTVFRRVDSVWLLVWQRRDGFTE